MRKIYTVNDSNYYVITEMNVGGKNVYAVYHGTLTTYILIKTYKSEKAAYNYIMKMGARE